MSYIEEETFIFWNKRIEMWKILMNELRKNVNDQAVC